MSRKIEFSFLEFDGAEEDRGRNGFSLKATEGLMKDPPLLSEYLKYAVGNGREISVKRGPKVVTVMTSSELDKFATEPSHAKFEVARQIATGLIAYHHKSAFDTIQVEYPHPSLQPEKEHSS